MSISKEGCGMTTRTIDQIRFVMTIAVMILIGAAMGVAPTIWASF
jgi:hypothetical protein